MPIFEYVCNDCKKEFEILVNSGTKVACKGCGSADVKKKLSLFGFSMNSGSAPTCAESGCSGFNQGTCGSGMCGG